MPNGRPSPSEIEFYEGLVRKTAALYAPRVQEDYDDIVAIFRVKVWRALLAFDSSRSGMPVERYVYGCLVNQAKDLVKRKRRCETYLEDEPSACEPAVTHDSVFGDVEREVPLVPSTLTSVERAVLVRLYTGRTQREAAAELLLSRPEIERAVRSIRDKMADWRPTVGALREAVAA